MKTSGQQERFVALRGVAELAPCSDAEIWSLLTYADEVRLSVGDTVAEEDRYCTELECDVGALNQPRRGQSRDGRARVGHEP